MTGSKITLTFTVHYNWEWVFRAAVQELQERVKTNDVSCVIVGQFQELPSLVKARETNQPKEKIEYSLFRIDVTNEENAVVSRVRLTSPIFQRMDAKDLFYHKSLTQYNLRCDVQEPCPYLPETILIPWNALEEVAVEEQRERLVTLLPRFPSYPAVLKAPMGSGGFGIYFVYHHEDIREVMNHHAKRAKRDVTVLRRLMAQYEKEPIPLSWSLQELIQPVKCQLALSPIPQRTQVRAYVVDCNDVLYLYCDYEVRCPSWLIDLDQTLITEQARYGDSHERSRQDKRSVPWEDEVEEECCGEGFARPYNEKRDKKQTYRLMIEEIAELVPAIPIITRDLLLCCQDQSEYLLAEKAKESSIKQREGEGFASLAIIGIDILVTENSDGEYAMKIVEVNNNPAMPGEGKLMTERYNRHLVDLHSALLALSVRQSLSPSILNEKEELRDFIREKSKNLIRI